MQKKTKSSTKNRIRTMKMEKAAQRKTNSWNTDKIRIIDGLISIYGYFL